MEIHKETPCVATFISNKEKCHFFSFCFYKVREPEDGTGPVGKGGVVPMGGGRRQGEGR
jgi:hypothetical protein